MFKDKYDLSTRDSRPLPPLSSGLTTAQYAYEFMALVALYQRLSPAYVVEVGTWHGGSLWYWLRLAAPGAHIISIDQGPEYWRPAEPDFDMTQWQSWVKSGTYLHTVVGDSKDLETIARISSICPQIDFLFIDGDHSYNGAKADFENYGQLVRKGGVIAFHDLIPPPDRERIQVGKLFKEIQQAGYVTQELYSMPDQKRMGIGVVYV
jgi:predicted O-methyltransferase YrrM